MQEVLASGRRGRSLLRIHRRLLGGSDPWETSGSLPVGQGSPKFRGREDTGNRTETQRYWPGAAGPCEQGRAGEDGEGTPGQGGHPPTLPIKRHQGGEGPGGGCPSLWSCQGLQPRLAGPWRAAPGEGLRAEQVSIPPSASLLAPGALACAEKLRSWSCRGGRCSAAAPLHSEAWTGGSRGGGGGRWQRKRLLEGGGINWYEMGKLSSWKVGAWQCYSLMSAEPALTPQLPAGHPALMQSLPSSDESKGDQLTQGSDSRPSGSTQRSSPEVREPQAHSQTVHSCCHAAGPQGPGASKAWNIPAPPFRENIC